MTQVVQRAAVSPRLPFAARAAAPLQVPSWDELCTYTQVAESTAGESEFLAAIGRLKGRVPGWRYQFARRVITSVLRDPSYTKMLNFTWGEIIDFLADQVVRNREIARAERRTDATGLSQSTGSQPLSDRADQHLFRPFNQMPCTRDTAKRRVARIAEIVEKDAPILLLGDDDLVSVELALEGFTDVTAVDIDPKVLAEIERSANAQGAAVRLVQHDLQKPVPLKLIADYRLVMFDPSYSLDGVKLFLDAALAMTRQRPGTLFFISVHLMSLLRGGLPELGQVFSDRGLDLLEFHQGFNAYPAPKRLKSLIHLANRIVIASKTLTTEGYGFPYLLSDALLLQKTS